MNQARAEVLRIILCNIFGNDWYFMHINNVLSHYFLFKHAMRLSTGEYDDDRKNEIHGGRNEGTEGERAVH